MSSPPNYTAHNGARLQFLLWKCILPALMLLCSIQNSLAQCTGISTLTCGTAVSATPSGAGVWNVTTCGFSTPGQEKVYSFTPTFTGAHTLQVNSVSGGYIDYFYKAASDGCSSTGWTCINDINFTGVYAIGTLTAGVQYYILLDPEATGAYNHNFQIVCPATVDPCTGITNLACTTPVTVALTGTGIWNSSTCFFSTPGQEKVYSFTPATTGVHSIQVTSASGTGYMDYQFKAASGGCSSTGWTCIDDINFAGTFPIGTLTAGVQYFILLDAESTSSSTQTFQVVCPVAVVDPCASITTLACATPVNITLSGTGVWNSSTCLFSTPGQEKVYSFTPATTGAHAIQVTAASVTGYIDYQFKAASGGCSATGWTCIDDINFTGTFPIGTLTAGVQYYILLDAESTSSSSQTFQINCPSTFDPCTSITTLSCATPVAATPSGTGVWNSSTCLFSTPGQEKVYSFTPSSTGAHSLQINSVSGGYIDYMYKAASGGCSATGWTCIDDINFVGTYPIGTLTAGVQYYILLDPEATGAYNHNFQIVCPSAPDPCANIPSLTCAATVTVSTSGQGAWNNMACGNATNGQESVFSFTPTVSGMHALNFTFTGNTGDYFFKLASGGCTSTGWTCIGTAIIPGTYSFGPLTAGTTYYILFDPWFTTSTFQTFHIDCPSNCAIICPPDVTIECDASTEPGFGNDPGTGNPTLAGCPPDVTLSYDDTTMPGTCQQSYIITRTWTSNGVQGGSNTCVQVISVEDHTAPIMQCPPDATIECDDSTSPMIHGYATATDNCDPAPTVTYTDFSYGGKGGGCLLIEFMVRSWTATDACGNVNYCYQYFNIEDNTPPDMICPQPMTLQCADQVPSPNIQLVTATDNCGQIPTISFFDDVITSQGCVNRFTINRIYSAIDGCSNINFCNQLIIVNDNIPPQLTCPPPQTVSCASLVPPVQTALVTATDNCGGSTSISYVNDVISNQTCANKYLISRIYRAIDACGNSATCTQTITVNDNIPPVISCPGNTTVQCASLVPPSNGVGASATDNCGGAASISFLGDQISNQICANRYIITRYYRATDLCGNSASCSHTITVNDNIPPVITCPANVSVDCASLVPPSNGAGVMASDNCGGGASISFITDVISAQTCVNRFIITRYYRATDVCGNSASCSHTITVADNTLPTLTCPGALTFQCASDVPLPNTSLVTATDNCTGGTSVSFVNDVISNQTCVNKYTITRIYRATDACGNSATCTQTIIVNDNTPPQLTCPGSLTFQCAAQVPVANTALVTASDNCSGSPSITYLGDVISNQSCVNKYTITRYYRATDLCGNSASCSQTIIVNDNTAPSIQCPGNVTVQCAGQVPAVNTAGVVTSDNCGPSPTITFVNDVISNQTCANRFVITRTYRSTDACNNSATCSQLITVFDSTVPSLTCPGNLTVQCASLVPAVNTGSVTTADNCGGTPTVTFVSDVISNQTCTNRYTLTRMYRSTDACGNSATCVQIITVFDNIAPVITFVDPLIANVANGGRFDVQCLGQDPNWDLPVLNESSVSVSDNCGTVTVGFSQLLQDEGNCPVDGYITLYRLTWTATDACGNSSSKFVFMALVDHIAPVLFNVPDDITVDCDEIPATPSDIYATDECISASNIQYTATSPAPGCQNGQVISRSWTATDLCGNKTTETQFITLIDVTPPEIQMLQTELAGAGDGDILQYTCNEGGIPEFYDGLNAESVYSEPSCGSIATIKFEKSEILSVNCKHAGYIEQRTFHWQAVDNCGNETNLTLIAQLVDHEAPVISGIPDTTCIDDPALNFIDATDNCGTAFLRYRDNKIPNPCGTGFAIRRFYEANDHCGNFAHDTVILIPNDHAGPVLEFVNPQLQNLPPGEVLQIDCEGQNGDYTPFGVSDVRVVDGCTSEVNVTFNERVLESIGCIDGIVATISLEWEATDVCGNVTKRTVQAFVVDHTSPVLLNFKPEITIGCRDSLPEILATDNCGGVNIDIALSIHQRDCEYEYDVFRYITATDPCGNATTASQIIHVGDGSGPVISGVVPELCDDLSIPDVTAFDPCSGAYIPVTMTERQLDSPCRDGKVYERTWTATDACGNVSTATQIIIVGDQSPPEIQIPTWSIILKYLDAPDKVFINLSQTNIIEQLNDLDDGSVYVEDECDQQVVPQFNLDVTYSGNCTGDGYFEHRVFTWYAVDICGNSSSISFDVYIVDDVAPVLTGVPKDATIICASLPSVAMVSSNDPAQPVSIVYSEHIQPGNSAGAFDVTRTWTATDACGNVTVGTQHITWIPDTFLECEVLTPAQVECNSHGVVISGLVSGGLGGFTYDWSVVGPGFIQSGQGTDQITIYVGWTTIVVNLTVRDAYGCETECSAVIDCIDSAINPFADTPPAVTPETEVNHGFATTNDQTEGGKLSELSLWPNPTNSSVNLSFESHAEQAINFRLVNFLGQDLLIDKFDAIKGYNTQKIDVSGIPEGSYLMEVKTDNGVYTKVVVIMRK